MAACVQIGVPEQLLDKADVCALLMLERGADVAEQVAKKPAA